MIFTEKLHHYDPGTGEKLFTHHFRCPKHFLFSHSDYTDGVFVGGEFWEPDLFTEDGKKREE